MCSITSHLCHSMLFLIDLPTSDSKMSLRFSGWEATKHRRRHGLRASQRPTDKKVYTMYHGTSVTSARSIITGGFRQSTQGMLGPGVYVSRDKKKAEAYPRGCSSAQRVILEVSVSVGRVKRIDTDNHELQYTWHSKGYDTAWVPPNCGMMSVPSGYEEDCVYDPKNVEVVGIAQAPNAAQDELTRLLAENQRGRGGSGGTAAACPVCKKPNTHGSQHILEQCWGCRATICVFMDKHFCAVRRQ